ncbi:MAG: UDP-3-O-(3-hydroxymyristoyl)glucosamine N-acyltransferase [Phycisphaeraceae bacterium]|nr:UDP-3-O-(3-hydroxymyristoyl)glucosamine N-acyltransferase [Phycisphaeraceae bacterium]MCW5753824.1 UDP-3-O-(3-hydroxymyristoyl)glucosamine N-acyltransferase [Phycisphaeraceae bacterium]
MTPTAAPAPDAVRQAPPEPEQGMNVTTGDLARLLDAELLGPAELAIRTFCPIHEAEPGSLTFIRDVQFASAWATSRASCALVTRGVDVPGHDPSARALLIVPNADLALARLMGMFKKTGPTPFVGIHPSAVVAPSARIGAGAGIGPNCTIGERAVIGPGAQLLANVFIGENVRIGDDSVLHPGVVVLENCSIGNRCQLAPGVVVGADGFGYAHSPEGPVKIPHIGGVRIEDDVEIGANTCVDRAKTGDTTIGAQTKIDNLVQIAHNCRIGRAVIICGNSALAGSVRVGDGAMIGGSVKINDGVSIGAGARIGANSGVMNDIPAGENWLGIPASPSREALAQWAAIRRLPRLLQRLRRRSKLDGAAD